MRWIFGEAGSDFAPSAHTQLHAPCRLPPKSALLVTGEGAHHAVLAAELIAASQRQVFGAAKMRIDGPAEGAAGTLGVDRHGGATALDDADDLAVLA